MAHAMQKNKIEFLEQRVDQLEMFISTLEEQNKFMKDIVAQQNELIKFMAEQNTVNIDKLASNKKGHVNLKEEESEEKEHIKSADNAMAEMLPHHVEVVKHAKKPMGRRVL